MRCCGQMAVVNGDADVFGRVHAAQCACEARRPSSLRPRLVRPARAARVAGWRRDQRSSRSPDRGADRRRPAHSLVRVRLRHGPGETRHRRPGGHGKHQDLLRRAQRHAPGGRLVGLLDRVPSRVLGTEGPVEILPRSRERSRPVLRAENPRCGRRVRRCRLGRDDQLRRAAGVLHGCRARPAQQRDGAPMQRGGTGQH